MIIHYQGDQLTPCGMRYLMPVYGTFHTEACMQGRETCIGIHIVILPSSIDPRIVNCPNCIAKMSEQ